MKSSMKRMLALVLSLMLLIPALAEDTEQSVQNDVVLEELDIPEGDASDDVELDLELDGAIEPSLDLSEGDLIEVPEIGDLVDEASTENAGAAEEGALADNAGETAKVRYIDARARTRAKRPVMFSSPATRTGTWATAGMP